MTWLPLNEVNPLMLFSPLVFQVTAKFAIMFITVQYNVTQVLGESKKGKGKLIRDLFIMSL